MSDVIEQQVSEGAVGRAMGEPLGAISGTTAMTEEVPIDGFSALDEWSPSVARWSSVPSEPTARQR
jgi:hypothetical protein